jgi:hypothetical protein
LRVVADDVALEIPEDHRDQLGLAWLSLAERDFPVGMKTYTVIVAALLVVFVGGLTLGGLVHFGVFKNWDGSYTGIVRQGTQHEGLSSASEPATITVMKKGSDAVVLFSMPAGGDCAIDVHRDLDRMNSSDTQKCNGASLLYFQHTELSLDGDSLTLTVKVAPDGLDILGNKGADYERTVDVEFVGTRSSGTARSFPKLLISPAPVRCWKPFDECLHSGGCSGAPPFLPDGPPEKLDAWQACWTECENKLAACCKVAGRTVDRAHFECADAVATDVSTTSPSPVKVRINTDPHGASVREDGVELCSSTPCDILYKGSDAESTMEHKLTFARNGYRSETRTLRVAESPLSVKLTRSP